MALHAGNDFGCYHRIGLETPSVFERSILAKHRHYHRVVKVQNNQEVGGQSDFTNCRSRNHNILFRNETPIMASLDLLFRRMLVHDDETQKEIANSLAEDLLSSLTVVLVGPEGKMDKMLKNVKSSTTIRGRPHVIYQWLAVLKEVNPLYSDFPELPDYSSAFKNVIDSCSDEIYSQVQTISDAQSIHI